MKKNTTPSSQWHALFSQQLSERDARLGKKARNFIVHKYYSLFRENILKQNKLTILELGAGDGEITRQILAQGRDQINKYIATELTKSGVSALTRIGVNAQQMDAQKLLFKDKSFDVVCAFDVMHHVPDPVKMAHEMTRVTKKYVFLIEANGLSIARKLLEKTAWYRSLGENSYFPWQYLSFFPRGQFKSLTIRPFLFVPPAVPDFLAFTIPLISETLERIPLLNWQCSGVVIVGEKKIT